MGGGKRHTPKVCAHEGCNVVLEYSGFGRPATKCPVHQKNRARTLRGLQERAQAGDSARARAAYEATFHRSPESVDPRTIPTSQSHTEKMAVGLALCPDDPVIAGLTVGLGKLPFGEAQDLAEIAREKHPDICDRKQSATGAILWQAITLGAIDLRDNMAELHPTQLATAIKASTAALKEYAGSTAPHYGEIKINFPGVLTPEQVKELIDKQNEDKG